MSAPFKNRCQKWLVFYHRFFRLSTSIWDFLGPPSWTQVLLLGALGRFLASSWALFKCPWDPLGLILVPRDLPSLHLRGSGDVPGWIFEGFLDFLLMLLWMWSLRICIHLRCSFTPSGAAVCAQHMESAASRRESRACQIVVLSSLSVPASKPCLKCSVPCLPQVPSPILLFLPPDPHIPPHFVRSLLLRLQNAICWPFKNLFVFFFKKFSK